MLKKLQKSDSPVENRLEVHIVKFKITFIGLRNVDDV